MAKKTIPIHIESENGHDTLNVPPNEVQAEVTKQVTDGKWATLEKKDGTTEVITEDDLDEEDKALADDWKKKFNPVKKSTVANPTKSSTTKDIAKKFEKLTSVTCTSKAKGG